MTSVCSCKPELSVYWPPTHVVWNQHAILGSMEQFCSSFFHIFRCEELKQDEHICLHNNSYNCRHRNVTVLAYTDRGVARYTNCLPHKQYPIHTETHIVNDLELLKCKFIKLYMQYQPCHHSGMSDIEEEDPRSCTDLIIDWYKQKLQPAGISLEIICSNIYKAIWYHTEESLSTYPPHKRVSKSCENARNGLRLLHNAAIPIRITQDIDWQILQLFVSNNLSKFKHIPWHVRYQTDKKLQQHLDEILINSKMEKKRKRST